MRHSLLRSAAALLIGTLTANAQEYLELPAVEITLPTSARLTCTSHSTAATESPRKLPPVNDIDGAKPADNVRPLEPFKSDPSLPVGIVPKTDCCLPPLPCRYLPDACTVCKPIPRFWFNLEYLLWTESDEPLNAVLFTQGPLASGGRLGAPGVRALFGGEALDFGAFNGGRIESGYWLNSAGTIGLEAAGFLFERGGTGFQAVSGANDSLVLTRPFVNPLTGGESARLITLPPNALGGAFAFASSHLWGVNTDLILNLRDRSCYRLDALVGFRYIDLRETLIAGDNTVIPGTDFVQNTLDSFATRNQFYGTELGLRAIAKRGRVDFSATFKLGLGVTHEVLDIVGHSDVNGPIQATAPAGFLAVESNSGRLIRDRFAVAPRDHSQSQLSIVGTHQHICGL